jgi:hypothetical protein
MGPAVRMGRSVHRGASCARCRELRAAAVEAAVEVGAHRLEPADVLDRAAATPDELTRHAGGLEGLLVAAYEDIQRARRGCARRMLAERVEAGAVETLPDVVPEGLEAAGVFAPPLSGPR